MSENSLSNPPIPILLKSQSCGIADLYATLLQSDRVILALHVNKNVRVQSKVCIDHRTFSHAHEIREKSNSPRLYLVIFSQNILYNNVHCTDVEGPTCSHITRQHYKLQELTIWIFRLVLLGYHQLVQMQSLY